MLDLRRLNTRRVIDRRWVMRRESTRRDFLINSAGTAVGLSMLGAFNVGPRISVAQAASLTDLEIFQQGYPRAFFFVPQTTSDFQYGALSYEEWEKMHLPLNGVMGKVISEERDYQGSADILSYVRLYKSRHPGKIAILYFNARGRVASDEFASTFFAGHWLYYAGTRLTRPVGSGASEVVLRVADPSVFSMGRYTGSSADDVAIVSVRPDGKPDWRRVEHVRLRSIKVQNKAIIVERGAYGRRTFSFPQGAYVAAHVMNGASTQDNIPYWSYNFSTVGPKDAQGRTGGSALADYLAAELGPNGTLSVFDGITFDAFDFVAEGRPVQAIDANGDGKADGGAFGGVNSVGMGTIQFTGNLRRQLPNKIIMGDCTYPERLQRSFGHLNGVESEGYPDLFDYDLNNTSKGTNLFGFWRASSPAPSLNYVNFKYRQKSPARDKEHVPRAQPRRGPELQKAAPRPCFGRASRRGNNLPTGLGASRHGMESGGREGARLRRAMARGRSEAQLAGDAGGTAGAYGERGPRSLAGTGENLAAVARRAI